MSHLRHSQCLLTHHTLTLLTHLLERDGVSHGHKQCCCLIFSCFCFCLPHVFQEKVAKATVYFLAVLCVARYRTILEAASQDVSSDIITEENAAAVGEGEGKAGGTAGGAEISREGAPLNIPTNELQDKGEERERDSERQDGVIQRPMSVETDSTATPDLEQTFHFPPVVTERPGGVASVTSEEVPASVTFYRQSMDTSEQIREALRIVGPFLCEVFVRERSGLARLLVGSDGKGLLNDGV